MRIASRTVRQIPEGAGIGNAYEIALDLRAETPPGPAWGLLSPCVDALESQEFWPIGGISGPASGGNAATTPAPGAVHYLRPGIGFPRDLQIGSTNSWHFPEWGAGGEGTIDAAGHDAQNRLRIIVEGPGTLTIHTATYPGGSGGGTFDWVLQHEESLTEITDDSGLNVATGSDLVVEIPYDGYCVHWVDCTDFAIDGFGFTGAEWVSSN